MNEKTIEKLKEKILYKRITKMDSGCLTLEDGTEVSFECTESDCCAEAYGEWVGSQLDAVITDVKLENIEEEVEFGEPYKTAKLVIYHNQNSVAQADLYADAGNSGYYYSILSVFVNEDNIGEILSCE